MNKLYQKLTQVSVLNQRIRIAQPITTYLPCPFILKLNQTQIIYRFSAQIQDQVQIQQVELDENDHRTIGKRQKLFAFSKMSPGSPFFLPHGTKIYNKLLNFIKQEQRKRGYNEIITPNLYNQELWVRSGHYDKYKENIYMIDDDLHKQKIGLKPMNCPGHCLLFQSQHHSYKDLPVRYSDFGTLHRNEIHGSLSGLTRVRRFCQDDAHIFCTQEQIQSEISALLEFVDVVYQVLGFEYKVSLSTRPEKYLGQLSIWDEAEKQLKTALNNRNLSFDIEEGEGAFYGPKIDVHLKDNQGRSHQCGTIQLDFNLPLRFNLQYRNSDQNFTEVEEIEEDYSKTPEKFTEETRQGFERPVMIHRAILGSFERMIAVLTEQTKGKWPFWISPRQILICSVSQKSQQYAQQIHKELFDQNFDAEIDDSDHTLSKKIRNAQGMYNFIIVVGEKEAKEKTVDVRDRDHGQEHKKMYLQQFTEMLNVLNSPFSK